jgi:hypothetical protein
LFVALTLNAQQLTIFDVPGGIGTTQPAAISQSGMITGSYTDPNTTIVRGFVRDRNGRFVTFDVDGMNTQPTAINAAGQITGVYYYGAVVGSFLRQPNGMTVTFDIPGVSYMEATVIDDRGQIAGFLRSTSGLGYIAFQRSSDGDITTFDLSGSDLVWPTAVNPRGQIVGYWIDIINGGQRGFIREPDGSIVKLDVPDVFLTSTQALAISASGQIAGTYEFICPYPLMEGENCTTDQHGFLREADGSYVTFNFPNALETVPVGIDSSGEIVGSYLGTDRQLHGFQRRTDGSFTTFDAPNATDTYVEAMNPGGQITGIDVDNSGAHGFVIIR